MGLLLAIASAPVAAGLLAGSASALDTTTTTNPPVTTTTLAPTTTTLAPTTTTVAPTTTTLPATTTTRAHASTTTSHPTTTTTTAAKASSSSATWGWILLAVVLVLAAALVGLLIARSRRQGRAAQWHRAALPAVAAAELARDLVLSLTETDDQQRRASVGVQVDEAVGGLERVAASAPDEATQGLCVRAGESLRGLAFAVEADHLLRSGGQHPTGEQLASADAARREPGRRVGRGAGGAQGSPDPARLATRRGDVGARCTPGIV